MRRFFRIEEENLRAGVFDLAIYSGVYLCRNGCSVGTKLCGMHGKLDYFCTHINLEFD